MKKTASPDTTPISAAILPIEAATQTYVAARTNLTHEVTDYRREVTAVRERYLPKVKYWLGCVQAAKAALEERIRAAAGEFQERRTIVLHGIKVGLQKGKGKLEWDDEAKVVERIRSQFSKSQADLLLDVKVVPSKEALLKLDAKALKKLGCQITGTDDQVVIKADASDLDKLIARILEEDGTKKAKEA